VSDSTRALSAAGRAPQAASSPGDRVIDHVTCLGCGCACDDIRVRIQEGRIVEAGNACALGTAWFGDGAAPARAGSIAANGTDAPANVPVNLLAEVSLDAALDAIAGLLVRARRPLVYLAPDLSCEAQRTGIAIADHLRAALDSVTSSTVMGAVLAAQERGTAVATLGEVRNRADVVVFWGVDPAVRYPRYGARYAPGPVGTCLPGGRASRTVIAVDVGTARGHADADHRYAVAPENELAVLSALAAVVGGFEADSGTAAGGFEEGDAAESPWRTARMLAPHLLGGCYVAIVTDAEPADLQPSDRMAAGSGVSRSGVSQGRASQASVPRVSVARASALIALAQTMNGRERSGGRSGGIVRCGLSSLRAGGNRSGADAAATAHTGFPCAIDFARGFPRYEPRDAGAEARLARGEFDVVLVLGAMAGVPAGVRSGLAGVPVAVVGPRASASGVAVQAFIDTGTAGIHEGGTVMRMDDVPVPLTAVLEGPPATAAVLRALAARLRA
jgi:formylmethanofuran dehydrogenase subunit B